MVRLLIARALCALAVVATASASACGCGGEGAPAEAESAAQTYVGSVDDSEVRLAVVRTAGAFTAYVCGHGDTLATHTRWFSGEADAGGSLEAVRDDWRLRLGVLDGGSLHGELLTPDGRALPWTAALAQAGTEEGLYDANHAGCRDGIIVWQAEAGPDCKAQGSWCDAQGQRGQVTPVVCAVDEPLRVQGVASGASFELIGERVQQP